MESEKKPKVTIMGGHTSLQFYFFNSFIKPACTERLWQQLLVLKTDVVFNYLQLN